MTWIISIAFCELASYSCVCVFCVRSVFSLPSHSNFIWSVYTQKFWVLDVKALKLIKTMMKIWSGTWKPNWSVYFYIRHSIWYHTNTQKTCERNMCLLLKHTAHFLRSLYVFHVVRLSHCFAQMPWEQMHLILFFCSCSHRALVMGFLSSV